MTAANAIAITDTTASVRRLCECGCGTPITSSRPEARYASGACRTRAWKARTGYRDERKRQASRNGTKRRRSAPSVRISYRKAVDAVTAHLQGPSTGWPEPIARDLAREILEPSLTPAGRRALYG